MPRLSAYGKHTESEEERLTLLFLAVSESEHALCDVILRVPGSESDAWVSIGSNSVFLRAKSAVFDAMWQSDGSAKGKQTIDIKDCSEEAIRALNAVAFGQWNAVEVTAQNVAELLYAALKYDFKLVVDCCQQFVDDVVEDDDIEEWLPVVSALYNGKLTDYATKVAAKSKMFSTEKITRAFECEAATGLPLALFLDLLKEDSLSLSEEVIWKQCVRWANENCEEQYAIDEIEELKVESMEEDTTTFVSAMRPLKEYIRFPLMSLEIFIEEVATTKLLTDSEIVVVCKAIRGVHSDKPLFCSAEKRKRTAQVHDVYDGFGASIAVAAAPTVAARVVRPPQPSFAVHEFEDYAVRALPVMARVYGAPPPAMGRVSVVQQGEYHDVQSDGRDRVRPRRRQQRRRTGGY